MTFFDLFSGIGGMRLGFEQAGGVCVGSSEINEHSIATYKKNFGDTPFGDITKLNLVNIPFFDVLLAGFPCQPFSIAGNRLGLKDKRANLFFEIIRVLRSCRPKAFLLENVKGLTTLEKGGIFKFMISSLEDVGYNVYWKVLNTKHHGNLPQNRERVFIVGLLNKQGFSFPDPLPLTKSIRDVVLSEKQDDKYYYDLEGKHKKLKNMVTNWNSVYFRGFSVYQIRRSYIRENKSNVCPCLMGHMGTGGNNVPIIKDDFGIRKLTPRECARFQGFPDSFDLSACSNYRLYEQIGNSVSVPVVYRLAQAILTASK